MMMLRVIVLASALALGKAAPSTSRNLAGRELGNRENCDGTPGNEQKCYKGTLNSGILAKSRDDKLSICNREESKRNTCDGCLECADPNKDVCEPRASEWDAFNEQHPLRTFSSMTTSPYYNVNQPDRIGAGPCCAWCDGEKHEGVAWKLEHAGEDEPARCEWNRYCSGCSECD